VTEDSLLNQIAIQAALDSLSPKDRELAVLLFHWERPSDWAMEWPPRSFTEIGRYLGAKYGRKALSEATVRYRRAKLLKKWEDNREK
jgi:hypothetical protein